MELKSMLARVYLGNAYQVNFSAKLGDLLMRKNWFNKQEAYVYLDKETGDIVITKDFEKAKRYAGGEI